MIISDVRVHEPAPVLEESFSLMGLHPIGGDHHIRAVLGAELMGLGVPAGVIQGVVAAPVSEADRQPPARASRYHSEVHRIRAPLRSVGWGSELSRYVIRDQLLSSRLRARGVLRASRELGRGG